MLNLKNLFILERVNYTRAMCSHRFCIYFYIFNETLIAETTGLFLDAVGVFSTKTAQLFLQCKFPPCVNL